MRRAAGHGPETFDETTRAFVARHGDDCARVPARWWQIAWYGLLVAGFLGLLVYRWDVAVCAATAVFSLIYLGIILFRTVVVTIASCGHGVIRVPPDELGALSDADLPVYTILVPLYHEANVAGKIVRHIGALDYPPEKLDVKMLLEADDAQTIRSVREAGLGPQYEIVVVPHSLPKTKPKACNHGLARARGELCVIYDAEDRPEPDQLRKVAAAFRRMPERVACIQAKLNFYNANQNLLTRWFTVEYSTWFDLFLPGLQYAGAPIPLGGTSNHFRTRVLRRCEGWDPFNVTEDCDLGVRIYRMGCVTRMIDSTTWEEANPRPWNWIRQRSRWVKGFFQTHLVHTRNPLRTVRQLGPWGAFGFYVSVGGSSLMMVMNAFYWIVCGVYGWMLAAALYRGFGLWEALKGPREPLPGCAVWPVIYYGPLEDPLWSTLSIIFFSVSCLLLVANFWFVAMHAIACVKRRFFRLIPFALLMPLYWVMISVGAWKGFIQLFVNPFYWEKTVHGLDRSSPDASRGVNGGIPGR